MDRIGALKELLAKVEAGCKYETMGHTILCQRAFPKPDDFDGTRESYAKSNAQMAILSWRNGSLDAAKALHDAVLPEWYEYRIGKFWCYVQDSQGVFHHPATDNPARAWLIAILKALIAQEGI